MMTYLGMIIPIVLLIIHLALMIFAYQNFLSKISLITYQNSFGYL